LSRRNRRRSNRRREITKVYCLLLEGQTERLYLEFLHNHEEPANKIIKLRPELPGQLPLDKIEPTIRDYLSDDYDKVIWIVDVDTYSNSQKRLREFENIRKRIARRYRDKVKVLINLPCFEIWYLLHFKETSKSFRDCRTVVRELKKYGPMKSYKKTEKFYKSSPNIYLRLRPWLAKAIKRAQKLDKPTSGSRSQMYKIFKILDIQISDC